MKNEIKSQVFFRPLVLETVIKEKYILPTVCSTEQSLFIYIHH